VSFFADLCQRAAAANLPFLLIGGHAVIAYGYARQTVDLDLMVRVNERRQWDELITASGYRLHQVTRAFHMYNPIDRSLPPLDLMMVDAGTFEKLSRGATDQRVQGSTVRVPALAHLIALKLHALRSGAEHRYEKDMGDVVILVQVNQVDLASPEYVGILDRYATAAIRTELLRRVARPGLGSPGA
jgi:predicted nucleotidyltransferase